MKDQCIGGISIHKHVMKIQYNDNVNDNSLRDHISKSTERCEQKYEKCVSHMKCVEMKVPWCRLTSIKCKT